ncbi:MAG: M56 family metallopeptidase [Vicinamibacterales bacterium]
MTGLLNHLWQSTLFLVAVWLVARALSNHRAAVRHGLWLAASLKFLVPFDALVAFGRQFGSGLPGATSQPLTRVIEFTSEPFSHPVVTVAASVVTISGPEGHEWPDAAVLITAWSVGFIAAMAGWGLEWLRTTRLVTQHRGRVDQHLGEALARMAQRGQRPVSLPIAVCTTRVEPGIFGIVRPVLIWPHALTAQLTTAEVEAILAHELCHVRRHDNLTAAVHNLVSAIFWFYPVVGWIGTQLHLERERACDEAVLRTGFPRRTYAESIVKTCEFCIPTHALAASGATGNLRTRVVGIMRGQASALMGHTQRIALGTAAASALLLPVAFGAASAPHLRAQAPAVAGGSPSFEVASVKQNTSGENARGFQAIPGGRVTLTNLTLRDLIVRAYETQEHLVVGGPDWVGTDRFDIVATATGHPAPGQTISMVRTLLADRFRLVMHRETRDMPIYNLVAARSGQQPSDGLRATTCVQGSPGSTTTDAADAHGRFLCGINRLGGGQILLTGSTLDTFANRLGSLRPVERTVINRTGLEGRFDINLTFTPGLPEPGADGLSLFTTIEERLGLTLVPARGPVEVLVIDSVHHPSPD